jgi:hypothetical protein
MKTKFGSIIVDGRGKIGGHVASKNRAGTYLRTKVSPANAQTPFQTIIRNRFTALTQGWRTLSEAQRAAWNAAVADYARTDIFGDIRNPSGSNLYQRLNNVLDIVGEAQVDTPPLAGSVLNVTVGAITMAVGTPALSVTFAPTVPADTGVIISATAPMSAGKSFVKSEFRQVAVLAAAATSPWNGLSAYVAKFGSTGAIGQKVFVKFTPVNRETGQVGSSTISSVISAT